MKRTIDLGSVRCATFVVCTSLMASAATRAQDCQNQIEIDICKAGCTVTGDVCGALCGAAVDVCTGVCIGGCAITCTIDCCAGFCPDSNACRSCIGGCERDCADGCQLDCDNCIFNCERDCESICRPFRKIGEPCIPLVDRCADGLTCWPFPMPGESQPQCFPSENDQLFPDDFCRSMYVSDIHEAAINDGTALSFGTGSASAVGVATSIETGVVYGEDGRFGCYFTDCVGGTVDVEVGIYAAAGFFVSYDAFRGEALVTIEEAGVIIVFAFAQFFSLDSGFLGVADIVSLEASLAPITAGAYDCFTIVDTVGMRRPSDGVLIPVNNSAPQAVCADVDVCADAVTCVANASVNAGSVDPDGDSLTTVQSPPGSFGIGNHQVSLTVTDPEGESDTCTALVAVNDCDPPEILCPPSTTVECDGDGGTLVDPGDASASDCTAITLIDPGASSYPVGTTTVLYSATDAAGNAAECTTTVTVVDTVAPVIMDVTATPAVLWPPNHKMQEVHVGTTTLDACSADLACEIIHVTSNEPDVGSNGGPDRPNDIEIHGPDVVMLRAERNGGGDGRVYTIAVQCTDLGGNTAEGVAVVTVPHDQGEHSGNGFGKRSRGSSTGR